MALQVFQMWLFWTFVSNDGQVTEEAAMHRRILFPLAAGIVGLVAISPALAASPSPAGAKKSPAKATTTTSGKGTSPSSGKGATSTTGGSGAGAGSQTGSTTDTTGGGMDSTATTETTAATDTSATTAPGRNGSTGTTANTAPAPGGSGGGTRAPTHCRAPATDQGPAPQMGESAQNHGAGDAGSVDVERLSPTELRIANATANSGWVQQVTSPSGPRVSVKFQRSGQSPTLVRFAASMDQAGRIIHVRV